MNCQVFNHWTLVRFTFQCSSLSSEWCCKSIIFGDEIDWHITNQNQIDIPIDVFYSNISIFENKKYEVYLGGKVNFATKCSFINFVIDRPLHTKNDWQQIFYLLQDLLFVCWYYLLSGLRKKSYCGTLSLGLVFTK